MPDLEFRKKHTFRQFYVMYDPLDMTQVRLYTKETNGMRYIATAEPYIKIHRNLQEQKPGEMVFIRQMDIANKQERVDLQLEAAELEMAHGVHRNSSVWTVRKCEVSALFLLKPDGNVS